MSIYYIKIFILTFILSLFFTFLIRKISLILGIFDEPDKERKIHTKRTALLGGFAVFLSFFIAISFVLNKLTLGDLEISHWLGVFVGAVFLMIGGFLDDKYNLKPRFQIIFPVLAILSVLFGGIEIQKISNPIGGFLYLDSVKVPLLTFFGENHYFVLFSDLIIFIWLLGMMYTTKLLDGVDGLVGGVTSIGAIIIFLFTMTSRYYQPDIGLASLILAAACLGFLVFNSNPASIFLGEGGSLLLGFILGVLAIISGGKIAIALLVMGLPIMDVAWAIVRRLKAGKNPFKFADRKHLHHRMLDFGLSQKQTVLIYYTVSATFGLSALFLQSLGKFYALIILISLMLFIIGSFNYMDKKKAKK